MSRKQQCQEIYRLNCLSGLGLRWPGTPAHTGEWPAQYLTEWGTLLGKVPKPEDETETRIISSTDNMNIVFEK